MSVNGIPPIPKGFTSITPYLMVTDGKAFLKFVKEAFGAEPIDEHFENGVLRHGALKIFGSMVEVSEVSPDQSNRTAIHLYVDNCQEVYDRAISAGAEIIHDVMKMEYGEISGGVKDPCGNHWYIATQLVDMYPSTSE